MNDTQIKTPGLITGCFKTLSSITCGLLIESKTLFSSTVTLTNSSKRSYPQSGLYSWLEAKQDPTAVLINI